MPEASEIADQAQPAVALVVAVRDEAENIAPLTDEIAVAMTGRWSFELIFVNDGSIDDTPVAIGQLMAERSWIRQINHAASCGKAAAVRTGVTAARAPLVVTLDGDCQNDPSFIPALVRALETGGDRVAPVAGPPGGPRGNRFQRTHARIRDAVRAAILHDATRDTACGFKAFRRDMFLALPFFDGVHRFLPALVRRDGYDVAYVDVIDRPRLHGRSKYGFWDRLWVGILDLAGVWWLIRRRKRVPRSSEVSPNAR